MKEYQNLLQTILNEGREKESGRKFMPKTIGLSEGTILMKNVADNFPLLTTKKMFWKGIIHELLWFLRGETNIKYLVDNNVNIWNDDAYRWYLTKIVPYGAPSLSKEEFIEKVKKGKKVAINDPTSKHPYDKYRYYTYGDLGKVYGYQWRNQNGVDQIADIIKELKENPFGRYKILDGWNKADFKDMALPPCHLLYQFIVTPMTFDERLRFFADQEGKTYEKFREYWDTEEDWINDMDSNNVPKFYLNVNMYQRSADMFLGVPFNLASMSLLLLIMSKVSNMIAGDAFWIGGDVHIYKDHIPQVKTLLSREPLQLPKMKINKEINSLNDIMKLNIDDFELINYKSHDRIKAELFTGLNKKQL